MGEANIKRKFPHQDDLSDADGIGNIEIDLGADFFDGLQSLDSAKRQSLSSNSGAFGRPESLVGISRPKSSSLDQELTEAVLEALSGEHAKLVIDDQVKLPNPKSWEQIISEQDLTIKNDFIGAQILNKIHEYEGKKAIVEDAYSDLEDGNDPQLAEATREFHSTAKNLRQLGDEQNIEDMEGFILGLQNYVNLINEFNRDPQNEAKKLEIEELRSRIKEYSNFYGIMDATKQFIVAYSKAIKSEETAPERLKRQELEVYSVSIKRDILIAALEGATPERLKKTLPSIYPSLYKILGSKEKMDEFIDHLIDCSVRTIHEDSLPELERMYHELVLENGERRKVSSLRSCRPDQIQIELYRDAKDANGKFSFARYNANLQDLPEITEFIEPIE